MPNELKIEKLVPIITERISKWGDIGGIIERGELNYFYKQPEYSKEKLLYKNTFSEKISENLKEAVNALEKINEKDFSKENIKMF